MEINIKVENKILKRKIKFFQCGNYVMNIVRYKNYEYIVGNGDEYLRGYDKVYELGLKLGRYTNG